jgi:hypothetical protein
MPNSNGWGDGTANNTIGWGQGSINNTIGWGSAYAVSDAGLTDIIGASPAPAAFAFTAKTDNTGVSTSTQFKLPLTTSTGLNIVVDWGDAATSTITNHLDAAVTHTYASAGTYSISITGTLPGFQFNFSGDRQKILNISNWGVLDITTNSAFNGCTNLTCTATDAPTISATDLSETFANAYYLLMVLLEIGM